jgi:predicted LPLAT superfamily acyltransferase
MGYQCRASFHERRAIVSGQWRGERERGSRRALCLIIWLALHCGRRVCRVLLVPICAYFFVTAPVARRSSQAFLRLALERQPGWRATFAHLFTFATTLLDRVYLVHGRHAELTIGVDGERVVLDALAAGHGCLLFGSHLGSFEMLSIVGSGAVTAPINVVMHVDESANIRSLLNGDDSAQVYRVIPLGEPSSMLRVKECLQRGEIVGILADRVYRDERTQSTPFLGRAANFSLSPHRLARITGSPVIMVFGLFRGGRRYDIVFEPLPEVSAGAAGVDQSLQAYVASLERQARLTPYNWFNFYDFWGTQT